MELCARTDKVGDLQPCKLAATSPSAIRTSISNLIGNMYFLYIRLVLCQMGTPGLTVLGRSPCSRFSYLKALNIAMVNEVSRRDEWLQGGTTAGRLGLGLIVSMEMLYGFIGANCFCT